MNFFVRENIFEFIHELCSIRQHLTPRSTANLERSGKFVRSSALLGILLDHAYKNASMSQAKEHTASIVFVEIVFCYMVVFSLHIL